MAAQESPQKAQKAQKNTLRSLCLLWQISAFALASTIVSAIGEAIGVKRKREQTEGSGARTTGDSCGKGV